MREKNQQFPMTNINAVKDSDHYNFIKSILGNPHMTVYKDSKTIALWYVEEDDRKALQEMEVENASEIKGQTNG